MTSAEFVGQTEHGWLGLTKEVYRRVIPKNIRQIVGLPVGRFRNYAAETRKPQYIDVDCQGIAARFLTHNLLERYMCESLGGKEKLLGYYYHVFTKERDCWT